ncbi:MAG: PH domain-containing protein [Bacteroidota bacterium]
MVLFQNTQIDINQLPSVEAIHFQRLDPAHVRVKYIANAIFFSILLAGVFYLRSQPLVADHPRLANGLLVFWILWTIAGFVLTKIGYDIEGYALREKDIVHIKGVINRRQTAIPFNRVQHCEIKAGPIQRFFNLKTLEVYTAGGQSSDLSIDGLKGEHAQNLKDFIIKTTGQEKASDEEE